MKKKCRVVMLSNKKAELEYTPVYLTSYETNPKLVFNTKGNPDIFYKDVHYHHLYLISDDEIKEGDWVIANGKLGKYSIDEKNRTHDVCTEKGVYPFKDCQYIKKVIASTDSEINGQSTIAGVLQKEYVGCIPESFIKAYVKANGKIDEVMVEYDEVQIEDDTTKYYAEFEWFEAGNLKLTDNNEVIISMVEEKMYSRSEIIALIKPLYLKAYHEEHEQNCATYVAESSFNAWIEENL